MKGNRIYNIEEFKKNRNFFYNWYKKEGFYYKEMDGLKVKEYHVAFIRDIPKETLFTTKPYAIDEIPNDRNVWIRNYYERGEKKYECYKFYDICHENFYKGNTLVYIDFIF